MKIPTRAYTTEFKELAVKRVKDGQSPGTVAKKLDLVEQTLRNWVKAFVAGTLTEPDSKQVTPEGMEPCVGAGSEHGLDPASPGSRIDSSLGPGNPVCQPSLLAQAQGLRHELFDEPERQLLG